MSLIRVGQRVELRGSTLRARGNGSRVLARNVSIVSSLSLSTSSSPRSDDDEQGDDEQGDDEAEIKGTLTSLDPVTVRSATRSLTCSVASGGVLAGFAVDDFVEITGDRIGGSWVLRKLKHEDGVDADDDDQNDHDHSGPGGDDDEDESSGSSGPGGDDDD